MFDAIAATGNRVSFENKNATITVLPNSHIALSFDDEKESPVVLSRMQIEKELGKTVLPIRKTQEPDCKWQEVSQIDLDEFKRRSAYYEELRRVTKKNGVGGVKIRKAVISRVSRELGDTNPPSPATLARWAQRSNHHSKGIASTLLSPKRRRSSSFSQDVQDYALAKIDDYYLQLGKPTVQYAYDCFTEDFKADFDASVNRPCRETFRKWIKQLDQVDVIHCREGRRAAKAADRNATRKVRVDRILERVEADAANLAIGLLDSEGRYIGTVTLFAVLDCFSRSVLGLFIKVGRGEDSASVIESYKHAICPKLPEDLPEEVESDWPMYGVFEKITIDGGPGYVADRSMAFVINAGSQYEIVETYAGWRKPFVERFFQTLRNSFAKSLRGYCGKYTDNSNLDATIKEKAVMTLPEFRSALFRWVADEYHHMPHRGLNGDTPYSVWQSQAQTFPPFVPADMEEMKLIKGEVKFCTISGSQGIQHNGRRYNDTPKRLTSIGNRLRALDKEPVVRVEYTHSNIQSVNVVDPFTDEIFEVCVNDWRIPVGMTEAEFRVKHKPHYKDKGATGPRATKSSRTVKEANQAHDVRMKEVGPRSANRIEPDKLFDEVQRLKKEGLQGQEDGKTQHGSVNTRTYQPTDTSYGNQKVYEDD